MKRIVVDQSMQEMTQHGDLAFPLAIYADDFADFAEGYINWHWHKEIQFSVVLSAEIQFFLEGQSFILKPGEAIWINKNILHQIKPVQFGVGTMFSLVMDETFVGGEIPTLIHQKFMRTITGHPAMKFYRFDRDVPWQREVVQRLLEVNNVYWQKNYGYELYLKGQLCLVWHLLTVELQEQLQAVAPEKTLDENRIKTAIAFIQDHYQEKLTLDEIAASIHVSRSECCRCFKRMLGLSPIEFVLQTRVFEAARWLSSTPQSISEVALKVGFNDLSYFGRIFKQQMGCSPSAYGRKSSRSEATQNEGHKYIWQEDMQA